MGRKDVKEEHPQIIPADVVEVKPEKDVNIEESIEESAEVNKVKTIDTAKDTPVKTLEETSVTKQSKALVLNGAKKENPIVIENAVPVVKKSARKEVKPWEKKPDSIIVKAPKKVSIYNPKSNNRSVQKAVPKAEYSIQSKEKSLPVWLKQKQEVKPKSDNIYRPAGEVYSQGSAQNSLALNRDNYEKLLTVEDYIYETQTFKRILNQEPTFIDGIEKGYFIIATLVYDFDEAITYQNELKSRGVNSRIFKDKGNSFYVYLYNSDNFYDVFMLRKAFIKVGFLSKVWILNINMKAGTLKKI